MKTKMFDLTNSNGVIIISGFMAVGKTTLQRAHPLDVIDLDSSIIPKEERGGNFGKVYADMVTELFTRPEKSRPKVILVSTHKELRDELKNRGIQYSLVYPMEGAIPGYLHRLRKRKSDPVLVDMLNNHGAQWIRDLELTFYPSHYQLAGTTTLSDVYDVILADHELYKHAALHHNMMKNI